MEAVSLASAVVQFVDFAYKIIVGTTEIYKSTTGARKEIDQITDATNTTVKLNERLKRRYDPTANNFDKLVDECISVSDELLEALRKVTGNNNQGVGQSIRYALIDIWSKKKITVLENRLKKLKDDLHLHLTVDLQ